MIIDSHHHFWHYNPYEYGWIQEDMKVLRRDFLPHDLKETIDEAGVDGVISVQARQTPEETEWLLTLANENPFILGVIGWLPIASGDFHQSLEKYCLNPKLVALRHVLQDEQSLDFIMGTDFSRGISLLKNYNLAYDILIYERQLPQIIPFVDSHPNQWFVLDHIAKPLIAKNQLSPWKENITELAKRENVFCKISGMVTEAGITSWSEEQLLPYFDVVLEAFKPNRLLFGSDWPVCLTGVSYTRWTEIVKKFISSLSTSEKASVMGMNARYVYRIDC